MANPVARYGTSGAVAEFSFDAPTSASAAFRAAAPAPDFSSFMQSASQTETNRRRRRSRSRSRPRTSNEATLQEITQLRAEVALLDGEVTAAYQLLRAREREHVRQQRATAQAVVGAPVLAAVALKPLPPRSQPPAAAAAAAAPAAAAAAPAPAAALDADTSLFNLAGLPSFTPNANRLLHETMQNVSCMWSSPSFRTTTVLHVATALAMERLDVPHHSNPGTPLFIQSLPNLLRDIVESWKHDPIQLRFITDLPNLMESRFPRQRVTKVGGRTYISNPVAVPAVHINPTWLLGAATDIESDPASYNLHLAYGTIKLAHELMHHATNALLPAINDFIVNTLGFPESSKLTGTPAKIGAMKKADGTSHGGSGNALEQAIAWDQNKAHPDTNKRSFTFQLMCHAQYYPYSFSLYIYLQDENSQLTYAFMDLDHNSDWYQRFRTDNIAEMASRGDWQQLRVLLPEQTVWSRNLFPKLEQSKSMDHSTNLAKLARMNCEPDESERIAPALSRQKSSAVSSRGLPKASLSSPSSLVDDFDEVATQEEVTQSQIVQPRPMSWVKT